MRNAITIEKEFNAPISDVFELLSKHVTYNKAFAPLQVVRVKDSADPQRPDGVGSIRRMGFGPIKPLQEEITLLEENKRIEYKLINNPLVKHHLGQIDFKEITPFITLVTYKIEFTAKAPLVSKLVLAQLKAAITLGFSKLAKSVAS
ncbi:SRPBCC family protein [Acinetobacter sp. C26M]|uniref:SRPBCC family protein n=1 Tax=unclassified Acinetobacter TaxID=196816 RepID=UPI0020366B09|nr:MULTISPECIES: SRPBCC family protein [unclassified Acinetobacter]USA48048.1 SRPBCC family protein [Acinetobacter sp. C26M]USA51528.1 SRPBCC family protein [Acinetobacter sp. C26G]